MNKMEEAAKKYGYQKIVRDNCAYSFQKDIGGGITESLIFPGHKYMIVVQRCGSKRRYLRMFYDGTSEVFYPRLMSEEDRF